MGLARIRFRGAAGVAAVAALAVAPQAAMGAVTVGQVGPPVATPCENGFDLLQQSTTEGNPYVVPGSGTITEWSTYGGSPGSLKLKVFRLIAPPATYQVVGHAGPQNVTGTGTTGNRFQASIRVEAGDLLGVDGTSQCVLSSSGGQRLQYMGDLADGASAPFTTPGAGRLNIQATFVPDNAFSLAGTSRNKKKGTATLAFDLPNPGQLSGSGKGAKVLVTSPKPQGSVVAPGTGPTQLIVKAKGRKRSKLVRTGKVKLTLAVTYTPTGGDPSSRSLKVKLIKKL